ncbi:DUF7947 five-stranded beta-barrel domain-containing protein [Pseudochrobactrum lubricantis]|uniref:DUF7947 five-stranded beta-barrel domain-containing protein n=1 Tax=Pseudochrobactrum lubricantis TaxID=558172 RepID=UPI004044D4E1
MFGRISSYNINTYKGRIFLEDEKRPVPFILVDMCRDIATRNLIVSSLRANNRDRISPDGRISCSAFKFVSSTER